jgi:hypothetical protein
MGRITRQPKGEFPLPVRMLGIAIAMAVNKTDAVGSLCDDLTRR